MLHPHPPKKRKIKPYSEYDKFMVVIGVVGPLFTLPQVIEVWSNNDTSGASIFTWVAYTFLSLLWLVYGVYHQERALIFGQAAYSFLCALVAFRLLTL
jgi:uncharacterized protein with PQ loop repeat